MIPTKLSQNKHKLFCFPYAGGSSNIYFKWNQYLLHSIELIPIELAGRGKRIHEKPYDSIDEMINDVFSIIQTYNLSESSYSFFGHSMGAIIAYEVAHYLIKKNIVLGPTHIFLSGRQPPHIITDRDITHNLPDELFKEKLFALGGTPKEFFDHPELLSFFLPLIRNDFKIVETYTYSERKPLSSPITVFLGTEEKDIDEKDISEWSLHSSSSCKIYMFPGDHFFINKFYPKIINIINQSLINDID